MKNIENYNLITKYLSGSRAYGTETEASDVDYRGIYVAPIQNIIAPLSKDKFFIDKKEEDSVYFELSNFIDMVTKQNPNILEGLWVEESDIVLKTEEYTLLRSYRSQMLSKRSAFTFSGYALSQMKRIKGHNKWINNPQPKEIIQQKDFVSLVRNFSEQSFNLKKLNTNYKLIHFGNDIYGIFKNQNNKTGGGLYNYDNGTLNISDDDYMEYKSLIPDFLVKFNREIYKNKKDQREMYWKWKINRNEKRALLEEKFAYDTKHAMHLVRLLRMAKEILTEHVVKVKREDAKELLEIRNGKWSYDELLAYSNDLDSKIKNKYLKESNLPEEVDFQLAGEIVREIYLKKWNLCPIKNVKPFKT